MDLALIISEASISPCSFQNLLSLVKNRPCEMEASVVPGLQHVVLHVNSGKPLTGHQAAGGVQTWLLEFLPLLTFAKYVTRTGHLPSLSASVLVTPPNRDGHKDLRLFPGILARSCKVSFYDLALTAYKARCKCF